VTYSIAFVSETLVLTSDLSWLVWTTNHSHGNNAVKTIFVDLWDRSDGDYTLLGVSSQNVLLVRACLGLGSDLVEDIGNSLILRNVL
jgi:hypothetical protein